MIPLGIFLCADVAVFPFCPSSLILDYVSDLPHYFAAR